MQACHLRAETTGHAELSVSLGRRVSNPIHLQSGLLTRRGIILSVTMQQSGEAVHRHS